MLRLVQKLVLRFLLPGNSFFILGVDVPRAVRLTESRHAGGWTAVTMWSCVWVHVWAVWKLSRNHVAWLTTVEGEARGRNIYLLQGGVPRGFLLHRAFVISLLEYSACSASNQGCPEFVGPSLYVVEDLLSAKWKLKFTSN